MQGMNFQKNPSNARRDEAEKELCYSRKVPLIVYQQQPNLQNTSVLRAKFELWTFRKTTTTEDKIKPEGSLFYD